MARADLQIRTLRDEDREMQYQVVRRSWQSAYQHLIPQEDFERLFSGQITQKVSWNTQNTRPIVTLAAEAGGTLVGCASLSSHPDGSVELTNFYVDPAYQRLGVGTKLWESCLSELKKRQITSLVLWVIEGTPAVNFYLHRGCTLLSRGTYQLGEQILPALQLQYRLH